MKGANDVAILTTWKTISQRLTVCEDEEATIYSDIFEIDAEIKRCSIIKKGRCKSCQTIHIESVHIGVKK